VAQIAPDDLDRIRQVELGWGKSFDHMRLSWPTTRGLRRRRIVEELVTVENESGWLPFMAARLLLTAVFVT